MSTDTWLIVICAMMANAVLFGAGAVLVLSIPVLAAQAVYLLPAVIVASFVAAPFVAALIAPRMRVRNWSARGWRDGDFLSG